MKKLFAGLACSFLLLQLNAQTMKLPLYQGKVPNAKKTTTTEEVDVSDVTRIGHVITPEVEVFLPAPTYATGQAVVICPGGGYRYLAYDKEGTDVAKWLNGYGIAAIVLKYRLPDDDSNEKPELTPLMDAQAAIKLVRANAEKWHIDTNKVGIMGFSAGGHLASTAGTHFDEASRPDFMILLYPVVTMKKDFTHMGSRINLLGENPSDELVNYYSNELQVKDNTPPTFIVHSEDDGAVPIENSLQLYQSLKDHNVPAELHVYPYGGHGYGLALGRGRLSKWTVALVDWLQELD